MTLQIYKKMQEEPQFNLEQAILGPCLTMQMRGVRVDPAKLRKIKGKKPIISSDGRIHPSWFPGHGIDGGLYCRTNAFGEGGKILKEWDIYLPTKGYHLYRLVNKSNNEKAVLCNLTGVEIECSDETEIRLLLGDSYRVIAKEKKVKQKDILDILDKLLGEYPEVFEWQSKVLSDINQSYKLHNRNLVGRVWEQRGLIRSYVSAIVWRNTLETLLEIWWKYDPDVLHVLAAWQDCILIEAKEKPKIEGINGE